MAALLGSGCASMPEDQADEAPAERTSVESLQTARAEIDRAIGEAPATNVSQCALAALGQRPCGGPRLYMAYSLAETDSASLRSLIEVYDRLDRQRNAEQGLVSTCEVLARPTVALEGGRCVTRPAG